MRISVIGCGYLGAVHAACMATLGHDVVGIDVDEEKIAALAAGRAPFYEPGLQELLAEALATGRLAFSTDLARAADAVVHFVCVGTPQKRNENAADLTYVDAAVDSILPLLRRATSWSASRRCRSAPPSRLADRIEEREPGAELVWNPEFLREGFAVKDTLHPDRLVYGFRAGDGWHARRRASSTRCTPPRWPTAPRRRDRLRHRPAGQGGRQLVPGHQDLLHQRDGRALRGHRRRRDPAGRRDRPRRPDRPPVPQRRARASAAAACPRTSARSWRGPASSAPTRR